MASKKDRSKRRYREMLTKKKATTEYVESPLVKVLDRLMHPNPPKFPVTFD